MSATNDGGPAFPVAYGPHSGESGMSLRDWFAGQAIGPLMASDGVEMHVLKGGIKIEDLPDFLAPIAYQIADAMLRARKARHD